MIIHTVQKGEDLSLISTRYGVSTQVLASLNGIEVNTPLATGQTLVVRFPNQRYIVKTGDKLANIAARFGVSLNDLYCANPFLAGKPDIEPGQLLVITYADVPPFSFAAGGYAYPFINKEILDTALPFIDVLIPFTYGIREDGSIYELNDSVLLSRTKNYDKKAWMHISTYTEGDRFDTDLAKAVLQSAAVQDLLINNILQTIEEKGYSGLDVDFEFLGKENASAYAYFLNKVTSALNSKGYTVAAALAPKVRDDQEGLLYEGHDYELVAAAVNSVLLMTYEWGYTYSAPMAISPVPQVRRVIEYALTKMPAEKIYLGISNYGYKWSLPYNAENPAPAPSLSTAEAFSLALQHDATILYDTEAQAPYFSYSQNGKEYEVWFEDARSLNAKLNLIPEYGLKGGLYWNLDRRNTQNLSLLYSLRKTPN